MNTKRRFVLASLVLAVLTAGLQAQEATRLGGAPSDTQTPVPQAKLPSNVVKGTGTAGKIPKWTGSGTLGNSVLTESGGKIGIGTMSPSAKLEVAGTARITDTLTLAPSGDQALDVSTGSIYKAGAVFIHNKGGLNTALGLHALENVTTGFSNTASGYQALLSNTAGLFNTASGSKALCYNTTGSYNTADGYLGLGLNTTGNRNTATGYRALGFNTTGSYNTASGSQALFSNTIGSANTASGYRALYSNTGGSRNTATGYQALSSNTTSDFNTATGYRALFSNTGNGNTASGDKALYSNTFGFYNTASGRRALEYNTGGFRNTATGFRALDSNTTGDFNTAIGYAAGGNLTTGNNNIDIGNLGVIAESATIRIGTGGTHTRTFVAGIRAVATDLDDAISVLISSNGQLGTISSSRRFKEDIHDMGAATERLLDLRAVLFRYKERNQNGDGPIEYGLIAEEVAEVFPDLVVYDDEGEPFTVKYHLLGTMLLNEMQKDRERINAQQIQITALSERLAMLEQRE